MSDYYYCDDDSDDDVFAAKPAKGKQTSRYGAWEQSELERCMFSWTLQDVLNRNLLKKKVGIYLPFKPALLSLALLSSITEMHMPVFIPIDLHLTPCVTFLV